MGPAKDVKGWQTCFNYLKSKTKEKLTSIRQYKMRFGESPTNIKLSEVESKIVEMCDINTLDGNNKVSELGLRESSPLAVSRARPNSTVVSSTDVAIVSPKTLTQNDVYDVNGQRNVYECGEPVECLSEVEDMNIIVLTIMSPTASANERQEIRSKTPRISSVRSYAIVDEPAATVESHTSSQASGHNVDADTQKSHNYGNAAVNQIFLESNRDIPTTEGSREDVSFSFSKN